MGRGRQKAKATRQARDMKYFTPDTDLAALERELSGKKSPAANRHNYSSDQQQDDQYADYADKYNVYDEDDSYDDDDGYSRDHWG